MASYAIPTTPTMDRRPWAGRIVSGVVVLMLGADALGKLVFPAAMIANTPPIGLPADIAFYRLLGAILAGSVALYAWPRTALVGAILLTGYLGGAIAINLRAAMPLFSHTLFSGYLGLFMWGGLWLRDARLRGLFA